MKKHGDPGTRACFERLTRAGDAATQAEGWWGLQGFEDAVQNFKNANDAFRAAVKSRPKDPKPRVRWGLLFLEHKQPADAVDLFNEALEIDKENADALLGLAKVASESLRRQAIEYAEKALKSNPKLVEAHELIAQMALEDNNPVKAREEAKKAVDMSAEAIDAMAILATADWLEDKQSTWMDKVMAFNPHYGEAYATAGHFFVINRRYREGIEYYRKAIAIEPTLWSARAQLGIELMRFGQNDEARQNLEAAFNSGYYDPAMSNTLKLMDSYKNYDTFTTPTTVLKLNKKESALLRPYFQSELDRVIATYEKKYHYKLPGPVQIEVYPQHEDFAVRTMGMPGLGALGVTFGQVVAMDSPSGRKPGDFHWAVSDVSGFRDEPRIRASDDGPSRAAVVYGRLGGVRRDGDAAGLGRSSWITNRSWRSRTRSCCRLRRLDRGFIHPELSGAGDGFLFPGRTDLHVHRGGKWG